jgi:hypothetical protein
MTRRGIVATVVILIVLIIGGWYLFVNRGPAVPYTVIENGDRQHKEDTEFYTIQTNYPDETPLAERGGWGAEDRALGTIEETIEDEINAFKAVAKENLTDEEKTRLQENLIKYSLNIAYRPYSSGSYVSYEFDVFTDTGGAHPNNYYRTLVFDLDGRTVELGDLFTNENYLERISTEATRQVTEQITQRAGAEAVSTLITDGLAPRVENFDNFVVDSDRLRIFIPPYQAAAYAVGSFEVQIPLYDIRDILKPEVR